MSGASPIYDDAIGGSKGDEGVDQCACSWEGEEALQTCSIRLVWLILGWSIPREMICLTTAMYCNFFDSSLRH